MHDVRFVSAENLFKLAQREPVLQRMNGADQLRDDGEDFRCAGEFRFQRAFGALRQAGNQVHFDTGFVAQAEDGRNGVFLGAADDEPGDDMGHAHGAFSVAGPGFPAIFE